MEEGDETNGSGLDSPSAQANGQTAGVGGPGDYEGDFSVAGAAEVGTVGRPGRSGPRGEIYETPAVGSGPQERRPREKLEGDMPPWQYLSTHAS